MVRFSRRRRSFVSLVVVSFVVVSLAGFVGQDVTGIVPLAAQLGTGLWNRVLIDATRNWKFERRAEWGGERFPPTVRPTGLARISCSNRGRARCR